MLYPFIILSIVSAVAIGLNIPLSMPEAVWIEAGIFVASFCALIILYALILLAVTPFFNLKKPQEKDEPFWRFILLYTCGIVLKLCRVHASIEGEEKLPKDSRWLLVCNHCSNFDPLVTLWLMRKRKLAFITKKENLKIPVAGPLMYKCRCLPLDRENDREALKTILRAVDLIKKDGMAFGIYPEGKRNRSGKLLEFRNGAFKIAQRAKVPIAVAVMKETNRIAGRTPWRKTDVCLKVCAVIDGGEVSGETTAETGLRVRKIMLENLGQTE